MNLPRFTTASRYKARGPYQTTRYVSNLFAPTSTIYPAMVDVGGEVIVIVDTAPLIDTVRERDWTDVDIPTGPDPTTPPPGGGGGTPPTTMGKEIGKEWFKECQNKSTPRLVRLCCKNKQDACVAENENSLSGRKTCVEAGEYCRSQAPDQPQQTPSTSTSLRILRTTRA